MLGVQMIETPAPPASDAQPTLDLSSLPLTPEFELIRNATEEDAYHAIWQTGVGLELLLHEKQLDLALRFLALPALAELFLLIARKWGKTTLALWLAEKIGRTVKNAIIRFAYPTKEQAKTIVIPAWEELTATCPKALRWNWNEHEGCYRLNHTNARLYMAGTDSKDQIERLRGPRSHFTVIDEPGSHSCNLEYLVDSILTAQLLTTGGKILYITTPPTSMEHQSVVFVDAARAQDRLVIQTIHDVPEHIMTAAMKRTWCGKIHKNMTPAEVDEIFAGRAEGSPAWEREALCKLVSDKSQRVTPEFSEFKHVGVCPVLRYRDRYVLGDAGFAKDFFAMLFCELDWAAGILWVRRELLKKRSPTKVMVAEALAIEAEIWSAPLAPTERLARIFDADPRTIADFCAEGYACRYAGKSEGAELMVKTLSNRLHAGNVMIEKACSKHLIPQLRDGIFKSDPLTGQKLDFQRTKEQGHLDAVAALAAGIRRIGWSHNPAPAGYLFSDADSVRAPSAGSTPKTSTAKALNKVFSIKSRLTRD